MASSNNNFKRNSNAVSPPKGGDTALEYPSVEVCFEVGVRLELLE